MRNELPTSLTIGGPTFREYAGRIAVFLDGEKVQRCTGFDVEKGTVTRQLLNDQGRIYVDTETDRVAVETVTGKVEVKWL